MLAGTSDEQPAPAATRGVTLVCVGDTLEFVDMGTGEVEGEHDPFSEVGNVVYLPSIVRRSARPGQ